MKTRLTSHHLDAGRAVTMVASAMNRRSRCTIAILIALGDGGFPHADACIFGDQASVGDGVRARAAAQVSTLKFHGGAAVPPFGDTHPSERVAAAGIDTLRPNDLSIRAILDC